MHPTPSASGRPLGKEAAGEALANIIAGRPVWTVAMISSGSMPWR